MFPAIVAGLFGLGIVAGGVAYAQSRKAIEIPAYTVERSEGDFELRAYPALTLAQVTRSGSRRSAVQAAFSPLARYIFARDRPGDKIAMTAPVVQQPLSDEWVVSFIMPAEKTVDDLPPATGDVRLIIEPARYMAAVRFSGTWTDARFGSQTDRLLEWVRTEGLTVAGAPVYGYYDGPFTPAFLRRNEVLVPVTPDDQSN